MIDVLGFGDGVEGHDVRERLDGLPPRLERLDRMRLVHTRLQKQKRGEKGGKEGRQGVHVYLYLLVVQSYHYDVYTRGTLCLVL